MYTLGGWAVNVCVQRYRIYGVRYILLFVYISAISAGKAPRRRRVLRGTDGMRDGASHLRAPVEMHPSNVRKSCEVYCFVVY